MSKFPDPLALPADVILKREKRSRQVLSVVKLGIMFRLSVILFELCMIFMIYSSSLVLDVISSLMDVFSSLFLILCMKLAFRPPDRNHPFGHGRYEPLGGLLLGILLAAVGAILFIKQLTVFYFRQENSQIHPYSWIIPAMGMIALEIAYRLMIRTAKKENSPALIADAIHYRIDSLSSCVATLALWGAGFWPGWSTAFDQGGALLISLFMIGLGFQASRGNFHQLMDRVPDQKFFERVRLAALQTPGVAGTEKIGIQQYGPDAHVDIDIEVDPTLSVDKAHQISQQVRVEIQKAWPSVRDVTVHIEPYYANDH